MVLFQEEDAQFAFKIDESSMDVPFTEFGSWFSERFCGAPSVTDGLFGLGNTHYTRLCEADMVAIGYALATMKVSSDVDRNELLEYLWSRLGYHIAVRHW